MAAMWDRLRTAPPQKPGRSHLDGGGSARGAYYGADNVVPTGAQASYYSYSIKGGPPPPRPPREFFDQQS